MITLQQVHFFFARSFDEKNEKLPKYEANVKQKNKSTSVSQSRKLRRVQKSIRRKNKARNNTKNEEKIKTSDKHTHTYRS